LWYNVGMTTDNWINLVAAILVGGGTLALAVMAYKAIRQTRGIQRSEKRERLLNEIIEWAEDIAECGTNINLPVNIKLTTDLVIDNLNKVTFLEYLRLINRGEYIEAVADKLFTEDLYTTVHKIILKLNGVLYIRGKIIEIVEKDEEEPLFDLAKYESDFTTKEEMTLIRKIKKELSSGTKDISELCDEYEGSLNELLSMLFIKIVDLKKELIR